MKNVAGDARPRLVFGPHNRSRVEDLTGMTFGRLLVEQFVYVPEKPNRKAMWLCRCSCGKSVRVPNEGLRRAKATRSCGCLSRESFVGRNTTHGKHRSVENRVWRGMLQRCGNPNQTKFARYGGRGITVCERWRESFANFFADMGPRPSDGHSIDRIDGAGNYEPSNCRWSTRKEQQNNLRNNRRIVALGRTQTFSQWSEETGVPRNTIEYRHKHGLRDEQLFTVSTRNRHKVARTIPVQPAPIPSGATP